MSENVVWAQAAVAGSTQWLTMLKGVGAASVMITRQAARLGLLTIQERRREGQKNLPNIVRVISREWLQWLRLGARPMAKSPASGGSRRDKQIGGKNIPPTANRLEKEGAPSAQRAADKEGHATL